MLKIISVFGGSSPMPGTAAYEQARRLGGLLARAGYAVATGGYMGTMEAASRGAAEAGGHVIGVTCEAIERWRKTGANPWVKEEIKYPTLRERLYHLVEHCHAAISLPGGVGTLSEIALTWSLMQTREIPAKPLVLVGPLWADTFQAFLRASQSYIRETDRGLVTLVPDVAAAARPVTGALDDCPRHPQGAHPDAPHPDAPHPDAPRQVSSQYFGGTHGDAFPT